MPGNLLVTLLIRLGVIASIAAVLVRSRAFIRVLYLPRRDLRAMAAFVLFLALPVAAGVAIRAWVAPNFSAADVSLPGALLAGIMAGPLAGALAGAIIALPSVLGTLPRLFAGQWLNLPLLVLAGAIGGMCRRWAPNQEEVWAFSPFIDLELWRWLRKRLNRPFRDWQALVFGVVLAVTLLQIDLARFWPARAWLVPAPHTWWMVAAIFAANVLSLAIPIKIWNNTRIEMKLEEQRRLLVQARLDALTSQINPHFLFNTLNTIASLVRFDPDTARLLIVKLSTILRRLLRIHESFVPLREELSFMDDYLDIEVVRFGPEKLRVDKRIEAAVHDWLIPSMLLQPVVENSIRHGLAPKLEGGHIVIRGRRETRHEQEVLVLEVEDNGVGMAAPRLAEAAQSGIGLSNVRERLQVLYGDAASLNISSRSGEGTRIEMVLPRENASRQAPAPAPRLQAPV